MALGETQAYGQAFESPQPVPVVPATPPGYPAASPAGQPAPGYPASSAPPAYAADGSEARKQAEQNDDSGLGLEWVWVNAEVGGSYVNLQSFNSSSLALQHTETGGPVMGLAAGVRIVFFTLGLHVRDAVLSSIGSLWQIDGEAAFHTRIGHFDPYFGVRGGYNFVGSLSADSAQGVNGSAPPGVSVHGFNVGPMFGFDYYFTSLVSIGLDLDSEVLFMQRPVAAVPLPPGGVASLPPQGQQLYQLYQQSGSSVGLSATLAPHLGLHF
jgi:hypothetical protein